MDDTKFIQEFCIIIIQTSFASKIFFHSITLYACVERSSDKYVNLVTP